MTVLGLGDVTQLAECGITVFDDCRRVPNDGVMDSFSGDFGGRPLRFSEL